MFILSRASSRPPTEADYGVASRSNLPLVRPSFPGLLSVLNNALLIRVVTQRVDEGALLLAASIALPLALVCPYILPHQALPL